MSTQIATVSCPQCRTMLQCPADASTVQCMNCGQVFMVAPPPPPPAPPAYVPPTPNYSSGAIPRLCQCGARVAQYAVTCPMCGRSFRPALLGIICMLGLLAAPIFIGINVLDLSHVDSVPGKLETGVIVFDVLGILLYGWFFTIWLRLLKGSESAWHECHWAMGTGMAAVIMQNCWMMMMLNTFTPQLLIGPIVHVGIVLMIWIYLSTSAVKEYCYVM